MLSLKTYFKLSESCQQLSKRAKLISNCKDSFTKFKTYAKNLKTPDLQIYA